MNINSALGSAIQGIHRGMGGLERNTAEVARATSGGSGEIAAPLVESRAHKLQVEASVSMVKTLDETIGSLLDTKA